MTRTLGNCWRCGEPIHQNGMHQCYRPDVWRERYRADTEDHDGLRFWRGLLIWIPIGILLWTLVALGVWTVTRL